VRRACWRVGLLLLPLLLVAPHARAHKLAPSLLELTEGASAHEFDVSWKTPRYAATPVPIVPRLPAGCSELGPREASYEGTGVRITWRVRCGAPLEGQTLRVEGLAENQSAALVRIAWRDGAVVQGLMNGGQPAYAVPVQAGRAQVSLDYARLGVEHILGGVDHLLFVLGLLLLVEGTRRLVWTVTAFTLGHSVTLAMATLGVLRYPVELVEFAIALSIFVVAVELTREHIDRHFLRRRPWLVAAGFGLLHGMGFAGALREVGLPAHEIPLALLAFNIGIELGQLAFIAVALVAARAWRRLPVPARPALEWIPVYLIGILSVYWCIERGLAALGAA
jgi:hydrogenase/urease accessory protein HupE